MIYVKDRSSLWTGSGRNRQCAVGVVAESSPDLRGAWTDYEFHNDANDPGYFKTCTVDWSAEGVTITEPTGYRLFLPKKAFVE